MLLVVKRCVCTQCGRIARLRGGRTYMQGMLAQFKGCVVDWRRGEVRLAEGPWQKLYISGGFWRDIAWWRAHLFVVVAGGPQSLSVRGASYRPDTVPTIFFV